MSKHLRVLWSEGLFLRPQHFQSQDAYHESRLQGACKDLHPYAWGLRKAEFDNEALASGVLRLAELSAVFADGEQYQAPQPDQLPQAISLDSMPDGESQMLVYIALPRLRGQGGNLFEAEQEESAEVRYTQTQLHVNDQFTDAERAEVFFLSKQPRLLTEHDQRAEFFCIPVARIQRAATGGFVLDSSFMPPVTSIAGSPWLYRQLRLLLDALQAKTDALYGHHRETEDDLLEFRQKDVASFWLLHTVTTNFAQLLHLLNHPGFHPERLFQDMLQLAGALLSFSRAVSLADLPTYDHVAPEAGFRQLFKIIRSLLEAVVSENYVLIPLAQTRSGFHQGQLESEQIGDDSRFFLSVSAELSPAELVELVPQRFKLGAPDDVEACVQSALPGIALKYIPRAPADIPVRPGRHYFSLENSGLMHERMLKSRAITVYTPQGLEQLELEFMAVTG